MRARGRAALVEVAQAAECDTVLAAIVGAAGLESTLAAAEAGKRLLLANKEAIVCAGALLMAAVQRGGSVLLPVDSEHNAIHQCLAGVSESEQSRCAPGAHGVGRAVPESRRSRRCHAGRSMRASEVGDGPQDFGRLGDADEQGT